MPSLPSGLPSGRRTKNVKATKKKKKKVPGKAVLCNQRLWNNPGPSRSFKSRWTRRSRAAPGPGGCLSRRRGSVQEQMDAPLSHRDNSRAPTAVQRLLNPGFYSRRIRRPIALFQSELPSIQDLPRTSLHLQHPWKRSGAWQFT